MMNEEFEKKEKTMNEKLWLKEGEVKEEWKPVTKNGYRYDETVSALQKSIRRGLEEQALFWSLELCEAGFDLACWRRLMIISVEDVGLADENVIILVKSLADMWMSMRKVEKGKVRLPETNILSLAILKLCRAKKNRTADDFAYLMGSMREGRNPKTGEYGNRRLRLEMPEWAIDGHTEKGKERLKEKYGKDWYLFWNKEFYEDVARLNKPVDVEGINWSKILMEKVGCDYEKYTNPIKNDKEDEQK